MTEKEICALLTLNRISYFHAKNIGAYRQLFDSYQGILSDAANRELAGHSSAGKRLSELIAKEKNRFDSRYELAQAQQHTIDLIAYDDDAYPPLLREIADPPLLLYKKGPLSLTDSPCIAVVGSRHASWYAREQAERFGRGLSEAGVTIVSGFARGVDTSAHTGALRGKGKTIAVFGCGIDRIYPRENKNLSAILEREGALVSEYSLGEGPRPYHFPRRNRIIAGMAQGVLIVEASRKSGSLITAHCALSEGRTVYAIPGKVDFYGAEGSNRLLKDGAVLVQTVADICEDMGFVAALPQYSSKRDQASALGRRILTQIRGKKEQSFDELWECGLTDTVGMLQSELTKLELSGRIKKNMQGRYTVQRHKDKYMV